MQGLFSQLTFVRHVQIEKLAAGVGHAADFSDALLKTGFVTSEVIADQLAVPVAQEAACMFASTARAKRTRLHRSYRLCDRWSPSARRMRLCFERGALLFFDKTR